MWERAMTFCSLVYPKRCKSGSWFCHATIWIDVSRPTRESGFTRPTRTAISCHCPFLLYKSKYVVFTAYPVTQFLSQSQSTASVDAVSVLPYLFSYPSDKTIHRDGARFMLSPPLFTLELVWSMGLHKLLRVPSTSIQVFRRTAVQGQIHACGNFREAMGLGRGLRR